jgi:hypothetical protein
MGRIGRRAIETTFTADRMATEVLAILATVRPDS